MAILGKLYRPKLFEFILIVLMICNTGFFHFIGDLFNSSGPSRQEVAGAIQEVKALVQEKVETARKKIRLGGIYSPQDYITDLAKIRDLGRKLGFSCENSVNPLIDILNEEMDLELFRAKDIHDLAEKRKDELEPLPDKMGGNYQVKISHWLIRTYLLNLLPATLLCALLLFQQWKRKKKELRLPGIWYFAWTVLFYPFYLTRSFNDWMKQTGRKLYVEAEYRRTKSKFFVYLTEREEKKIKNFAENGLPIVVWRQMLKLQRLRPVHCLATVLMVMIVIAILPKPANAKSCKSLGLPAIPCQEISSHLARMDIDNDPELGTLDGAERMGVLIKHTNLPRPLKAFGLVILTVCFHFLEVWKKIVHIPLSWLFDCAIENYHFAKI